MLSKYIKLYDAVVTNDDLTTKVLNEAGYNAKGINELIEEEMIKRISRGHYQFLPSTDLYEYGNELMGIDNAFATSCVKKCYELNPTYVPALKFLLIGCLRKRKCAEAFEYLKEIIEIDQLQNNEYKLYLLVLSRLIKIPEEYINLANHLVPDDMRLKESGFTEEQKEDYYKIILSIYNHNHSLALRQIAEFGSKYNNSCREFINIFNLLASLAKNDRSLCDDVQEACEAKDYQKIVATIKSYGEKYPLKNYYKKVLFVAEEIINIKFSNLLPEPKITDTDDYKVAIDCCNYPLAYKLYTSRLEEENRDFSKQILARLLCDVTMLINKSERDQYTNYDNDRNLVIKEVAKLIEGKPVVLLPPMSTSRIDKIKEVLLSYPDVSSFVIMEPGGYRLAIKAKIDIKKEKIDRNEFYKLGVQAYQNNDYTSCIKYISPLLRFGKPSSSLYALVAFSYLKLDKVSEALDYLIISNYLSSVYSNGFDHSELIAKLKKTKVDSEFEVKPFVKMKEIDFEIDDNYGIDDFDSLNEYIIQSKKGIKEACLSIDMTNEEIDKVILLYAKKYFMAGIYEKGEQFLKAFERSENKTSLTLSIYSEIQRNKKIYINQKSCEKSELSLILVP